MQSELFGSTGSAPSYPEGFRYRPDVIGAGDERALVEYIRSLPFKPFEFHGYTGKRRVVSFGWSYDFAGRRLREASEIPEQLLPLRSTAARFAAIDDESLQQALVTEYAAGAGIGWHRDKGEFGEVVGVSLLASCVFRLRRKQGDDWERVNLVAAPRSAYLLSGAAR